VSIRFGLVVGLLFAIVVTYLTSINPSRVHVALGGDWAFDIPLMALIAVVFGAGAGLALVIDAFNFSLLFAAVGVQVPLLQAMAAYPALLLSFAVPAGPGYVGNLEVAGALVLGGGLGLPSAVAAGAVVLYHAITAGYVLVLGLASFLLVGGRRRVRAGGPRRIAVFHCGFTYSGGGERIVIEEVLGLRRRGFEVECYAPTVDASRCYPDLIGEVRVRTFLPQLPRWFPFREAVQMAAASLLMPLYAWRFRGVDAIVGCNQPSAWIAWWAARLIDVPYVLYLNQPNRLVYPRSIDRETGWVANADYRLLAAIVMRATKFVAWADRRSVQEADQVLVNGDYIGDIIRSIYKRDAVDCPAGCHVAASGFPLGRDARFSGGLTINGYPIRRPYVLLTNRHYPQKRFDLAIRIADLKSADLIAAKLARRCEVQLAYAIGVAEPVSVNVDTFGTNTVPETAIMKAVQQVFDLTPKGIINALDLRKPIYSPTSSYGHFGREPKKNGKGTLFTWERLDRVTDLKKAVHGK